MPVFYRDMLNAVLWDRDGTLVDCVHEPAWPAGPVFTLEQGPQRLRTQVVFTWAPRQDGVTC